MRAWICEAWGGPDVLRPGELPEPDCDPDQVLIAPQAWGVNFADLVLIAGQYQARPAFPFAPGMEVAGCIVGVGENVHGLADGDRVAAYVEYGGYADLVAAPAANVAVLPDRTPFRSAAAFPVPFGTAMLALERASAASGETALVGGAAGAVGAACVALLKLRDIRVIAGASTPEKRAAAIAHGADHALDPSDDGTLDKIREISDGGVDMAFDPIGGTFFDLGLRALRYGGRLITLGFASGGIPQAPVNRILVKHVAVIGSSFGLTCHQAPEVIAAQWSALVALLDEGRIAAAVAHRMGFEDLPTALERLQSRAVAGRIVLE